MTTRKNTSKTTPSKSSTQAKKTARRTSKKVEIDDDAVRVLKKYPNRRLYDTATSTYITLAQVKQLVLQAQPFVVRDAKTDENITRSILLQIILEEEASGSPIFTETVLANIIRFYGHALQGFFGANLEGNIQAFVDMQNQMVQTGAGLGVDAWQQMMQEMMRKYTDQSGQVAQQMQQQMQQQYQNSMQQWMAAFNPKK